MRKIVVAGAGHGGLTAAYNLSKYGYDVTVIEKGKKEELGHDWHDAMDLSAFDFADIPRPEKDKYLPTMKSAYISPNEETIVEIPVVEERIYMDRKILYKYLIEQCEGVGVKFIFEKGVKCPITQGDKIKGVVTEDGEEFLADLVIDACGMHSPVRRNLPEGCLIQKEIIERDIFHVYRAYFKNTTGEKSNPPSIVSLFHMNRPGIGWIICEDDYVDVLVGKFGMAGELTEEEIEADLADTRRLYPFIGEEIVRGGNRGDIPLRRMISKIVADGYAAVGDSAGMTIPLNGSGIILSMKAGKILADTVMKTGNLEYTTERLWSYQYEYYQDLAHWMVLIDVLKNFFVYVEGDHVDYLMKRKVLNAEKFAVVDGGPLGVTPVFLAKVAAAMPHLAPIVPKFLMGMKGAPILPIVKRTMPRTYTEESYLRWAKVYNAV